jgi:hypothetical protein
VGIAVVSTQYETLSLEYQEREIVVFEFRDPNAAGSLSHGVFPELEDICQPGVEAVRAGKEVVLYEVTGSDNNPVRNRYYLEEYSSSGLGNAAVFVSFRTGNINNFTLSIRRIELNDLNGAKYVISYFEPSSG